MDTSDHTILFDGDGVCNHCLDTEKALAAQTARIDADPGRLKRLAAAVSERGKKREYDCLIGLSGGVDSSYVVYLSKQLGLRPLVVHFDNGWDSEIAVSNIKKLVHQLGFGLATYVIDWEEFRDLQRSFFRASVIDIEMITDHAIVAAMVRLAREHRIPFVLSGTNLATENGMPREWTWHKQDLRNIKAIHKRFGERPLRSFPMLGTWRWVAVRHLGLGPRVAEPLNMIHYRRSTAVETLNREFGWQDYGGKHYESVFTRFYQAYVLPRKFGVDKRRVHFSSLIRNGELTREEALTLLERPAYPAAELEREKHYVLKKLQFSEQDFDSIMAEAPVPHDRYATDQALVRHLKGLAFWARRVRGRSST